MNVFQRITELGVSAATGTGNASTREAARVELVGLRDELAGIANSRYLGQPLFAGFAGTNAVAFDSGTSTWNFTGSSSDAITRKVSDTDVVRINVTAQEAFSFGGTNAFAVLDQMATAMAAGDSARIMAGVDQMGTARSTLSRPSRRSAPQRTVSHRSLRNSDVQLSLSTALSSVEDIDLATAITDQSRLNATYQAALGATAKTLQPSLVDWLR
jgi:flagellar hook-associated protein 3 FlgL